MSNLLRQDSQDGSHLFHSRPCEDTNLNRRCYFFLTRPKVRLLIPEDTINMNLRHWLSPVLVCLLGNYWRLMPFAVSLPIPEASVVFYGDKDFRGIRSTYVLGDHECVNLNGQQNDHYSSVDIRNKCVTICEHEFCRGRCVQLTNSVPDLSVHGFNDLVSAVRPCNETVISGI